MGDSKIKDFVVENRIEELPKLAEQIEKLAEGWELSPEITMNINLVLEEAISNIIFYAFNDKNKHEIKISIELHKNKLSIKIKDNGIPFNPLSNDSPDISLSAEERPVGGLGIYLISQIMDDMEYARKENQNVLTLSKRI